MPKQSVLPIFEYEYLLETAQQYAYEQWRAKAVKYVYENVELDTILHDLAHKANIDVYDWHIDDMGYDYKFDCNSDVKALMGLPAIKKAMNVFYRLTECYRVYIREPKPNGKTYFYKSWEYDNSATENKIMLPNSRAMPKNDTLYGGSYLWEDTVEVLWIAISEATTDTTFEQIIERMLKFLFWQCCDDHQEDLSQNWFRDWAAGEFIYYGNGQIFCANTGDIKTSLPETA